MYKEDEIIETVLRAVIKLLKTNICDFFVIGMFCKEGREHFKIVLCCNTLFIRVALECVYISLTLYQGYQNW